MGARAAAIVIGLTDISKCHNIERLTQLFFMTVHTVEGKAHSALATT
jgi:hypothetical protein